MNKKIQIKKRVGGYTLVELLIGTGVLSIAVIGIYGVANVASDWRKSSQEIKSLNMVMKEIDSSTNTTGSFTGITLGTLPNYSSTFNSSLILKDVLSPSATKLNFVYDNINTRVCNDFANKMLESSNNIGAIINGKAINKEDLSSVASACDGNSGVNAVTIVLNKIQDNYTINNVVASVNPPPTAVPDIVIPTFGPPASVGFPTVPGYVPSTATPVTYPITTGTPPTFGPIVGGGGPITTTPGGGGPVTPVIPGTPGWSPPPVYKPPATVAGKDEIDQNPEAPAIVTTETRGASCPAGYTGSVTERRTRTYYPGTRTTVYSSWTQISNNCVLTLPTYFSKNIYICQAGYMWEGSQNSDNHCGNPANKIGSISLTLANGGDRKGRVSYNLLGFQNCNWGEPGEGPVYGYTNPSWAQDWQELRIDAMQGNMRKDVFDAVVGYVFSCGQTGS